MASSTADPALGNEPLSAGLQEPTQQVAQAVSGETEKDRTDDKSDGEDTYDSEESEEDELDKYIPEGEIRGLLCACLDAATSAGAFAHSDVLRNAPNPGLCINGLGSIGFPLADHDIQNIVAVSEESMDVKGICEVSGDKIEVTNPALETLVKSVLGTIAAEMGISKSKGLSEELYALVLYKSGSST